MSSLWILVFLFLVSYAVCVHSYLMLEQSAFDHVTCPINPTDSTAGYVLFPTGRCISNFETVVQGQQNDGSHIISCSGDTVTVNWYSDVTCQSAQNPATTTLKLSQCANSTAYAQSWQYMACDTVTETAMQGKYPQAVYSFGNSCGGTGTGNRNQLGACLTDLVSHSQIFTCQANNVVQLQNYSSYNCQSGTLVSTTTYSADQCISLVNTIGAYKVDCGSGLTQPAVPTATTTTTTTASKNPTTTSHNSSAFAAFDMSLSVLLFATAGAAFIQMLS